MTIGILFKSYVNRQYLKARQTDYESAELGSDMLKRPKRKFTKNGKGILAAECRSELGTGGLIKYTNPALGFF